VTEVDPSDDSKTRYIVFHYRFDAARRERRNVQVAAFDDEAEFLAEMRPLPSLARCASDSGTRWSISRSDGFVNVSPVYGSFQIPAVTVQFPRP